MRLVTLTMTTALALCAFDATADAAAPDCASVYALRGLDPHKAAQRRRPGLEAASELRHAVRRGCAAEVIALAKQPSLYETRSGQALNAEQRLVLRRGLMIAVGDIPGEEAAQLLKAVIEDPSLDPSIRRRAAESMGRPGLPWVTERLARLLSQPTTPAEVKAGALLGLGRTEDPSAVPVLAGAANRAPDLATKKAAITGLGSIAIRAEGKPAQAELRSLALRALVDLLYAPELQSLADDVIENLVAARAVEAAEIIAGSTPSPELQAPGRALQRLHRIR